MKNRPQWPSHILKAAGVYNLLWGAWTVLFPNHWFQWTGVDKPNYPGIWQCVGMIVGVYGIGYWIASRDYVRHWPIVFVGLLGKVFGPIGLVQAAWSGELPWNWLWMCLTNDLIWWMPFAAMLYLAFKFESEPNRNQKPLGLEANEEMSLDQANLLFRTDQGQTISELSASQKVLLVFLRHGGCTFCRESLDQLSKSRETWEGKGILPVIVHMGDKAAGKQLIQKYSLTGVPVISDPECRLFRAYHLARGNWRQLFGPRVWIEGFKAAILKGYGFGKLQGDGFQLSGAFVVQQGEIMEAYPSKDAADSCPWRPALASILFLLFAIPSLENSAISQVQGTNTNETQAVMAGIQIVTTKPKVDGNDVQTVEVHRAGQTTSQWVLEIRSQRGIGSCEIKRKGERWPNPLLVRFYLRGLEQVDLELVPQQITSESATSEQLTVFKQKRAANNGSATRYYRGGVGSTDLEERWEIFTRLGSEGEVEGQLLQPKLQTVRICDARGQTVPKARIPIGDGQHFEWTIPAEWLQTTNPDLITIRWIDFFRN